MHVGYRAKLDFEVGLNSKLVTPKEVQWWLIQTTSTKMKEWTDRRKDARANAWEEGRMDELVDPG